MSDLTTELTPTDAASLWTLYREFNLMRIDKPDLGEGTVKQLTDVVGIAIFEMADFVQEKYLEQLDPENWNW